MDASFIPIFELRYSNYRGPSLPLQEQYNGEFLSTHLRRIIDRQVDALPNPAMVRSDARLVLLINLDELVARPVSVVTGGQLADLLETIEADVGTLLKAASDALPTGRKEISSGAILRAVGELWSGLGINQLKWWGPDE
jgi:hypothetical protein